MSAHNIKKSSFTGIPDRPDIVDDILKLNSSRHNLVKSVELLTEKYPQFFQRILCIINSEHLSSSDNNQNMYQAINSCGLDNVIRLSLLQIVFRAFNQYKVSGIDMQAFWQDSLHRAVCAQKLGALTGLNAQLCFTAGFVQDIGYILLFLEQPQKAMLWSEFRKREPQARLNMEQSIFKRQHDTLLKLFLQSWGVFPEMLQALSSHHNCSSLENENTDKPLCNILHCADWVAAVFTANDKSFLIDRCRKMLKDEYKLSTDDFEKLLAMIPEEVELNAQALGIGINKTLSFSQILAEANIQLNKHNSNFQELNTRLDQALAERDRLSQEIDRDLNLAREIQQSLLPESRGNNYPLSGVNLSAKKLSGDFYDFFELESGDIYFNLGDVSGKGVNAALLMAKTCSLFRCLGKRIDEPATLLYEINNELCETSIHGMFVTMVAGLYSPEENTVHLVNAGNPPALLLHENGICQEFEATAPPLGVIENMTYAEYKINLKNGSLYMYSDGVTEGYINKDKMLELSGLFSLISKFKKDVLVTDRLSFIVNTILNSGVDLRDDVTLLLLKSPECHG